MFYEEQLDPLRGGNLRHILTVKDKSSSTFCVSERVESGCYLCSKFTSITKKQTAKQ